MDAMSLKNPALYARITGFAYLLIFALAIYANFFVFEPLSVPGDPGATLDAILDALPAVRVGIACFFIVLLADVVIGWGLYLLLRPVHPHASLLAILFRLVYTSAHVGALLHLVTLLEITDADGPTYALGEAWRAAMAGHLLNLHGAGFTYTLIFFGVHLLIVGALIAASRFLPAAVGVLVMLAGAGYIIDAFGVLLVGGYDGLALVRMLIVIAPALIGEGILCLWLLIAGVNRRAYADTAR